MATDVSLQLDGSTLALFPKTMEEGAMLQHRIWLVCDEIAFWASTVQARLVVFTHMHIHRRWVVGEIPTMGAEHELHVATIAQLDLVTSKGCHLMDSSQAAHHSEHTIIIIGKWSAVSIVKTMENVVKFELPLMSTPG